MDDKTKQTELNKYLRDLSAELLSEDMLIDKSRILLPIYDGNFRHSYSQILGVIIDIKKNGEGPVESATLSLDYLTENVQLLKEKVIEHQEFEESSSSLNKLYDHVMLEISRLNYIGTLSGKQHALESEIRHSQDKLDEGNKKLEDEAENLRKASGDLLDANVTLEKTIKDTKSLKEKVTKANTTLQKTIKETESLKSEVVTIIGIFAAIMLAFAGGMNFTSATLNSMHQSSIYKVIFVSVLCGFTFFNTIFCLMYIISRMTKKDIYSKCQDGDCVDGECQTICDLQAKVKKRLPYVYWINNILFWILIITVIAWFVEIKTFAEGVRSFFWNKLN